MHDFNVGDIVVIREWDEMAAEYGYNRLGSIDCTCSFTRAMQHLCGEIATISEIGTGKGIHLEFMHKKQGLDYDWNFSTDMIRIYDECYEDDNGLTDKELIDFITG